MKALVVLVLAVVVLAPGMAHADAATDATLGLGAFAVFNQILSGTGVFGGFGGYAAHPRAVVVHPPVPRVVVAPVHAYPWPVIVRPGYHRHSLGVHVHRHVHHGPPGRHHGHHRPHHGH